MATNRCARSHTGHRRPMRDVNLVTEKRMKADAAARGRHAADALKAAVGDPAGLEHFECLGLEEAESSLFGMAFRESGDQTASSGPSESLPIARPLRRPLIGDETRRLDGSSSSGPSARKTPHRAKRSRSVLAHRGDQGIVRMEDRFS